MNQRIRRALVVDDNQLNSRLAALFLKKLGWETRAVDDGALALSLLAEQTFDLMLLDLRMPNVSGEQVCRTIRDDLGLSTLPVIAYTAHSMPEEKARILGAGFNGLLIKPISYADVREICDNVVVGHFQSAAA